MPSNQAKTPKFTNPKVLVINYFINSVLATYISIFLCAQFKIPLPLRFIQNSKFRIQN